MVTLIAQRCPEATQKSLNLPKNMIHFLMCAVEGFYSTVLFFVDACDFGIHGSHMDYLEGRRRGIIKSRKQREGHKSRGNVIRGILQ